MSETQINDMEIALPYLEQLAGKWDEAAALLGFMKFDPRFTALRDEIASDIAQDSLLISSHNAYISSLPVPTPVEPPSGFEAFLRNTTDFLDATVGTLTRIVADGLSTVVQGIGKGIGNMFSGNPVLIIGLVAAGLILVPRFTQSLSVKGNNNTDVPNTSNTNNNVSSIANAKGV